MKYFVLLVALIFAAPACAAKFVSPATSGLFVCDGVTDDTPAINAALVAGGIVYLPPGICIVHGVTMQSRSTLQGAGRYATWLRGMCGTTEPVIITQDFATLKGTGNAIGPSQWAIRDLIIDGNKDCRTAGDGLDAYGWDWSLENVDIANAKGVGIYSEWGTTGHTPPFPPAVTGEPEVHFRAVRIYGNAGDGAQWYGPNDAQWSQVLIYQNGGAGLKVNSLPTSTPQGLSLSQVHIYSNGSWGLQVSVAISVNDLQSESAPTGGGIQVNSPDGGMFGANISVYNNKGPGLEINKGWPSVLTNVVSHNNTGTGINLYQKATLSNVASIWNSGDGIVFGGGATGSQIIGANLLGNSGKGAFIQGSNLTLTGIAASGNVGVGLMLASGIVGLYLQGQGDSNHGGQLVMGTLGSGNSVDFRVAVGSGSGTWSGTIGNNNVRILSSGSDSRAHFVGLQ